MNWSSKLNPFGNYDDPKPPVDLWQGQAQWWRWVKWHFIRNPLHNFTFYWIGLADKPYLRRCNEVFSSIGKWNIILPFISYQGKRVYWYFGWRGDRSNFGIKFVIRKKN